jgi:hypothetical protein
VRRLVSTIFLELVLLRAPDPDGWLGLPTGVVVLLVVLMALFMFWGGEHLERIFGGKDLSREPKLRFAGAGAGSGSRAWCCCSGSLPLPIAGDRISAEKELLLNSRAVYVHPAEVVDTMYDFGIRLVLLDVRSEADYNLFHVLDARRVDPPQIWSPSAKSSSLPSPTRSLSDEQR